MAERQHLLAYAQEWALIGEALRGRFRTDVMAKFLPLGRTLGEITAWPDSSATTIEIPFLEATVLQ
jgi:hypothetical protein